MNNRWIFYCNNFASQLFVFQVAAILPAFYLDYDAVNNADQIHRMDAEDKRGRASVRPDAIRILRQLKTDGILFTTPDGDYDDSYTIEYAKLQNGIIVSNDRYRDAVYKVI